MAVEARFRVVSVDRRSWPGSRVQDAEDVKLEAVTDGDTSDDHPNEEWSKYTPSGELTIEITNPRAFGYFEPGARYSLILRKVKNQGRDDGSVE